MVGLHGRARRERIGHIIALEDSDLVPPVAGASCSRHCRSASKQAGSARGSRTAALTLSLFFGLSGVETGTTEAGTPDLQLCGLALACAMRCRASVPSPSLEFSQKADGCTGEGRRFLIIY